MLTIGYIQTDVYTNDRAVPIAGATVSVFKNVDKSVIYDRTKETGEDGKTPLFEVETPAKSYSLQSNATAVPYETYDMHVEAAGFLPIDIHGVQVFEGEISLQPVEMIPIPLGIRAPMKDTVVNILPHNLYSPQADTGKYITGGYSRPPRLSPIVRIPENIIVHLGKPSEVATDIYVPFIDYIKGVAASTVYPTWPQEALRANIYAQISFALNRVYTEWYRVRGYNFQITNSPAYDQSYTYGRNYFGSISRIVDEIFNQYLHRPNNTSPFFATYCDGVKVQCEGLQQWGSVDYANEGHSAQEILNHYYGPVVITTVQVIEGMSQPYPGEPMQLGDSGENVRMLQTWLNRIGESYPDIPYIPISGIFDDATREAVQSFQKIFDQVPDGVVGPGTWGRIEQTYTNITKLATIDAEVELTESTTGEYPGYVVREGQRGANVRNIQSILALLASVYEEIDPIDVSGIFDSTTAQAVKQFQILVGLTPDGVVGERTWNALQAEYEGIQQELEDTIEPYPNQLLHEGSQGGDVEKMQIYLNEIATVYPGIPTVAVDGVYGPAMTEQVKAYQREFGLIPDGIIGRITWESIVGTYHNLRDEVVQGTEETQGTEPGGDVDVAPAFAPFKPQGEKPAGTGEQKMKSDPLDTRYFNLLFSQDEGGVYTPEELEKQEEKPTARGKGAPEWETYYIIEPAAQPKGENREKQGSVPQWEKPEREAPPRGREKSMREQKREGGWEERMNGEPDTPKTPGQTPRDYPPQNMLREVVREEKPRRYEKHRGKEELAFQELYRLMREGAIEREVWELLMALRKWGTE